MENVRSILTDRLSITSTLFRWSPHHVSGFVNGMEEAITNSDHLHSEASWHRRFDIEPFCFKGRETTLSDADLRSLGRYEAWRAVESWIDPSDQDWSQEDIWKQVRFWWDSGVCSYPSAEAEADLVDDFDVSRLTLLKPESWWERWIVDQHFSHMAEGRDGFADLFLEKHWYPKFYVENGADAPDILDGWHRSAADVLTGQTSSWAVIVSRKPEFVPTF